MEGIILEEKYCGYQVVHSFRVFTASIQCQPFPLIYEAGVQDIPVIDSGQETISMRHMCKTSLGKQSKTSITWQFIKLMVILSDPWAQSIHRIRATVHAHNHILVKHINRNIINKGNTMFQTLLRLGAMMNDKIQSERSFSTAIFEEKLLAKVGRNFMSPNLAHGPTTPVGP